MIHLYLSYIPNFITENQIWNMCQQLNLFSVKQITFHTNNYNGNFHTGIIFIKEWFKNEKNQFILNELKLGHSVYLMYQFPLYIKCSTLKKNDYSHSEYNNRNRSNVITRA